MGGVVLLGVVFFVLVLDDGFFVVNIVKFQGNVIKVVEC